MRPYALTHCDARSLPCLRASSQQQALLAQDIFNKYAQILIRHQTLNLPCLSTTHQLVEAYRCLIVATLHSRLHAELELDLSQQTILMLISNSGKACADCQYFLHSHAEPWKQQELTHCGRASLSPVTGLWYANKHVETAGSGAQSGHTYRCYCGWPSRHNLILSRYGSMVAADASIAHWLNRPLKQLKKYECQETALTISCTEANSVCNINGCITASKTQSKAQCQT